MVAHDFNPAFEKQRQVDVCEFLASLLHKEATPGSTVKPCLKRTYFKEEEEIKLTCRTLDLTVVFSWLRSGLIVPRRRLTFLANLNVGL